ncbi:unnamed protein product [Soboliphyme baturini]|uniref:WD_REPEATS_REGION domain-containing protein n=1 Tax=Soboliphyme baturini TaxID=241478 RepID=A0A183IJB0_9BILA|nr:unnamed protein product [Soboliphyme baturini]
MNAYVLWKNREYGHADFQVRVQMSNLFSKRNCRVRRRRGIYAGEGLFPGTVLVSGQESLLETASTHVPNIFKQTEVKLGRVNKVFAATWFANDKIVMGTKCNKLLVLDVNKRDLITIPSLKSSLKANFVDQNCGIHAIRMNPSETLLATGAENPADVAVYRLPSFEPVTVGETGHCDWLFDMRWLDDEFLISGTFHYFFSLSLLARLQRKQYARMGVFCVVPYLTKCDGRSFQVVTSVSLNSYLHMLDLNTFQQVYLKKLDMQRFSECVCICYSPDDTMLCVGSRSRFTFFDSRSLDQQLDVRLNIGFVFDFIALMPSGVRSITWRGPLITLGMGSGEILFYDVRNCQFLSCSCHPSNTLRIRGGYLQEDDAYQEIFMNYFCYNAVYAHCYDPSGIRLFAAGGPIAASLYGNCASILQ